MKRTVLPRRVGSLTESWIFRNITFSSGPKIQWLFVDAYWFLDPLLGYDDEFELKYPTGESYLNWGKRGLIPKYQK